MARISQVYNKSELLAQKKRERHLNKAWKVLQVIQFIAVCYLLYKAI